VCVRACVCVCACACACVCVCMCAIVVFRHLEIYPARLQRSINNPQPLPSSVSVYGFFTAHPSLRFNHRSDFVISHFASLFLKLVTMVYCTCTFSKSQRAQFTTLNKQAQQQHPEELRCLELAR
jgi:hypothetical protein